MKIAVLGSGEGTNAQAIIDACRNSVIPGAVRLAASNNSTAGLLDRARKAGIAVAHISSLTHPDPEALDSAMADLLKSCEIDLVVAVGYMKKIGPITLGRYRNRVLNIHPALLPKFGGEGMYGIRVHEAVLESEEQTTGATIHVVDEEYDQGPIVAQRTTAVLDGDTPTTLRARVLAVEHALLVDVLVGVATGAIDLDRPRDPTVS